MNFLEHISSTPAFEPPRTASIDDRGSSNPRRISDALHQQAVPQLPYMLDLPRHLALIATIVVKAKRYASNRPNRATGQHVEDFIAKCIEIDCKGVACVRQSESANLIPVVVRVPRITSRLPPGASAASIPGLHRAQTHDIASADNQSTGSAKLAATPVSTGFIHSVLRKASKPDLKGSRRPVGLRSASTDSVTTYQPAGKMIPDKAGPSQDLFVAEQPKRSIFNKFARRA